MHQQIAESFRRFGITDTTQHVMAVKVGGNPDVSAESVSRHLEQHIQGEQVPVSDETLGELVDVARLKKTYKLNSTAPKKGTLKDAQSVQEERKEMEIHVLGSMALKGS